MNCDLEDYHSREQQGYFSSLHWLLELHFCAAKALTDSEARSKGVTKRTIIMYCYIYS
jgi:ribonuclease HI